jgi:hypothetical protein
MDYSFVGVEAAGSSTFGRNSSQAAHDLLGREIGSRKNLYPNRCAQKIPLMIWYKRNNFSTPKSDLFVPKNYKRHSLI